MYVTKAIATEHSPSDRMKYSCTKCLIAFQYIKFCFAYQTTCTQCHFRKFALNSIGILNNTKLDNDTVCAHIGKGFLHFKSFLLTDSFLFW